MKAGLQRLRWLKLLLMGTAFSAAASGHRAEAQTAADDEAWLQAQTAGTIQAFETYLFENPGGEHASEAFRCVVELSINLPRSSCAVEPAAGPAVGTAGPTLVDLY